MLQLHLHYGSFENQSLYSKYLDEWGGGGQRRDKGKKWEGESELHFKRLFQWHQSRIYEGWKTFF